MKTIPDRLVIIRARSEQGSALVMTVITGLLVGTVLGSYLMLINTRNRTAMRAMAWNTAIPVLEAGIEEALVHLNQDRTTPAKNNWNPDSVNGQAVYWKKRTLPDGSSYYVTNFNVDTASPRIISAGHVRSPLSENDYVARIVEVGLTNPPGPFFAAIAANGTIRLAGNSLVDGYDSSRGPYDAVTNRNADGNIGTNSKETPAIYVGNGQILGTANTGAGGTVDSGAGSIGNTNWTSGGIEPGYTNDNFNVNFPDNQAPTGAGIQPSPTHVGTSNVTYLTGGFYQKSGDFVTLPSTGPIIAKSGNSTLYVTGNFIVNGSYYVRIEPGASLTLYVGGKTANISGLGVINASGMPNNFSYVGLPGNTTVNYNGSSDFVGTINAPEANFNLSGSATVYGAIICNTFASSGTAKVHYDRSLRGSALLLVTSWRELPVN